MRRERENSNHKPDVQGNLDFEIGFYRSIIDEAPDYVDALKLLGEAYTKKGMHTEGLNIDKRLAALRPSDPISHYNLACSYSLVNRKKEALQSLRKSIELGFYDVEHIATDKDLANLHRDASFRRIVHSLCKQILKKIQKGSYPS